MLLAIFHSFQLANGKAEWSVESRGKEVGRERERERERERDESRRRVRQSWRRWPYGVSIIAKTRLATAFVRRDEKAC